MAKSNYRKHIKSGRNEKRKQFPKGGSPKWLRTRHRMRKRLVRF